MTTATTTDAEDRQAHRVDLHVGLKLRQRRRGLNMSQHELARALGLTFQQVQKYERGANRISASKLYEAAGALDCQVSDFFAGLPDPRGEEPDAQAAPDPFLVMSAITHGAAVAIHFAQMTALDRSLLAGLARRFVDGNGDLPTAALSAGMSSAEMAEEACAPVARSEIQNQTQLRRHYARAL